MAVDVKLPELGEGVTEGELVKWLVKPGDSVKADQSIAEVMTDKATVEVPSPVAGVVKELKFKPGQIIKVESVMLTLEAINGVATKATSSAPPPSTPVASHGSSAGGHIEVKLPELGEGVTEGEIVRWLVKPGDSVKADQAIAEVMTDKATVEVPSPFAGVVKELKFKVGEVVKVESTLLVLEGSAPAGASRSASHSASPTSKPLPAAAHMNFASQTTPSVASTGAAPQASGALEIYPPAAESRVLATPATRRLARELGVDINNIKGTGLAGRVTRDDVLAAKGQATAPSLRPQTQAPSLPKPAYHGPAGALEERVPLVGIRKKIAENMQRSKAIIPHFTIMDEADVTELVALRESLRDYAEKAGTKITYLPFVIKALIATVREFPMFVASIDDAANEIVYKLSLIH
ncbi:MAG: 2-oxo acid dehydrogenase subunit E2, partial [Bdellovibrionaceae bacterium]|nr:2-oxo acid dehydrogenase subunit E2 [Pseudobdellovibrionaceae bacterium]